MIKILKFYCLLFCFIFLAGVNAQVKIKELKFNNEPALIKNIVPESSYRNTSILRDGWSAILDEQNGKKINIRVPASFSGNEFLIFRKEFSVTADLIANFKAVLKFQSVLYSAEIYVNDILVANNGYGGIPFDVEIPADILTKEKSNVLLVKTFFQLDSENTFPTKQTFQIPALYGGILKDVILQFVPNVSISNFYTKSKPSASLGEAEINFHFAVNKKNDPKVVVPSNLSVDISVINKSSQEVLSLKDLPVSFNGSAEVEVKKSAMLSSPELWSPENPAGYTAVARLKSESTIIDEISIPLSIYSLSLGDNKIMLNGQKYEIDGVVYYPVVKDFGSLISYNQIEKDLTEIKRLGFNSVRFSKITPDSYALKVCNQIGLLAFIDLPVNSLPDEFSSNTVFKERVSNYFDYFLKNFSKYPAVAAIGFGSAYRGNSESHLEFLAELAKKLKNRFDKLSFASFVLAPSEKIQGIDLIGLEFYNKKNSEYSEILETAYSQLGKGSVFISEATYSSYYENQKGYKYTNSYQAQAKFFEDLIDYTRKSELNGFFINSMFEYTSEFTPLSSGYNSENLVKIGIAGENRNVNRLSYRVIFNKLNNKDREPINLGTEQEGVIFFIVMPLILAVLLALLINSKRKFREDTSRALFRPYNFYADIRDQRILSGFHSNFLLVILTGSLSLLLLNLLYYLRTNPMFEKILLSFGSNTLIEILAYFAWNPKISFVYLFLISVFIVFFISLLIQLASFFVKTKVLFSNVYFMVTWSLLPLSLMLVVEMALNRLLKMNIGNEYIFIFVALFFCWILQRLIKGIYVIFDIRGGIVYFYSILILLTVFGSILFYFHSSESTIFYIISSVKQYLVM